MDPLSIGSAIVGLIAAVTRIAPLLQQFISHTRDAPKSAWHVLDEMQSTKAALEQVQIYIIDGPTPLFARREMLSLHNLVTTLTACVTTYSDLERVVNKCVSDGKVRRVRWIYHENEIGEIVQKVQHHKLSFTFMLSILQCGSQREARTAMDRLSQLVERVLDSNEEIRERIAAMSKSPQPPAWTLPNHSSESITSLEVRPNFVPAFEEDLNNTRVYKRVKPSGSPWSNGSSHQASMALSAFSNLTLADVSIVSVFCLPVYCEDLSNAGDYGFGKQEVTMDVVAESYRIAYPRWFLVREEYLSNNYDGLGIH